MISEFAAKEKLEIIIGAAKPRFRIFAGGGISSPPSAAKTVRTISRIDHEMASEKPRNLILVYLYSTARNHFLKNS